MSNGGVDMAGNCLRCGKHVQSSGGCVECGPYSGDKYQSSAGPTESSFTTKEPEYIRASGETLCEICQRPFYRHEWYRELLGYDREPFLRRICNGQLVKL